MGPPRSYPAELRGAGGALGARSGGGSAGAATAAIRVVAEQLGVHAESVRNWVRQAELDKGRRAGRPPSDKARIAELERENRSCAGRTRSSRAQRLSSGRSSTADRRSSRATSTPTGTASGSSRSARSSQVAPSTYYAAKKRPPCRRRRRATSELNDGDPPRVRRATTASTAPARCGASCNREGIAGRPAARWSG